MKRSTLAPAAAQFASLALAAEPAAPAPTAALADSASYLAPLSAAMKAT